VVRNAANESVVWVHESAERFVSRKVKAAALDGHSVAVTDGLTAVNASSFRALLPWRRFAKGTPCSISSSMRASSSA
jgi:hypothetical protein